MGGVCRVVLVLFLGFFGVRRVGDDVRTRTRLIIIRR